MNLAKILESIKVVQLLIVMCNRTRGSTLVGDAAGMLNRSLSTQLGRKRREMAESVILCAPTNLK